MYEQIINHKNDISIYVAYATVPLPNPNITIKKRRRKIVDFHIHNEYEFIRVNRGVFRCLTLDDEFILEEGDVMFINKNTPHSTYTETTNTHNSVVQFCLPSDADSITRYISKFTNISNTPAYAFKKDAPESAEIIFSINSIIDEYKNRKPFWADYVYNHMLMLITALRRQGILSDDIKNKIEEINKIRPVLDYINENYTKQISTLELSRIMNFNETYFCRLFKSIVGTSAINYINFIRICKAEKLLKDNVSLLEIAFRTGFSSQSYFNRIFKKYHHRSPNEYKKILNSR